MGVLARAVCAFACFATPALAAPPFLAPSAERPVVAEMMASTQLEGPQWKLVDLGGSALSGESGAQAHLMFQPDGRFSGSTGCNRVSGSYTADAGALTFGAAATTRMACKGAAMQTEDAFLRMLEAVSGWRVEGSRLHLLDAGGQTLATFAVQ